MNQNKKEDSFLLSQIEDRIRQCEEHYMITTTGFLDMRQRTLAESLCRKHRGLRYAFYGGYGDAERRMAVFFPEYVELPGAGAGEAEAGRRDEGLGEAAARFFQENPEDDPLTVVRAVAPSGAAVSRKLTHRDYLGSLVGLGLKREMIGDILVRPDGTDILAAKEIEEFLLFHYGKAGRASLELSAVPVPQLIVPEGARQEKSDTVASLRLDNVIASVFSTSRSGAADAVRGGLVFVNGMQVQKPDTPVKEGDRLVLRGKGKAILKEVGGQTRKDRIFVRFDRFL